MKFFVRDFVKRGPISNFLFEFSITYPTPANLSYFWNFGFLALICLVFQIITGIVLAMHYTPHVDLAFSSIEHIMRDVNYGYFLRYAHANGASAFFLLFIFIFWRVCTTGLTRIRGKSCEQAVLWFFWSW